MFSQTKVNKLFLIIIIVVIWLWDIIIWKVITISLILTSSYQGSMYFGSMIELAIFTPKEVIYLMSVYQYLNKKYND